VHVAAGSAPAIDDILFARDGDAQRPEIDLRQRRPVDLADQDDLAAAAVAARAVDDFASRAENRDDLRSVRVNDDRAGLAVRQTLDSLVAAAIAAARTKTVGVIAADDNAVALTAQGARTAVNGHRLAFADLPWSVPEPESFAVRAVSRARANVVHPRRAVRDLRCAPPVAVPGLLTPVVVLRAFTRSCPACVHAGHRPASLTPVGFASVALGSAFAVWPFVGSALDSQRSAGRSFWAASRFARSSAAAFDLASRSASRADCSSAAAFDLASRSAFCAASRFAFSSAAALLLASRSAFCSASRFARSSAAAFDLASRSAFCSSPLRSAPLLDFLSEASLAAPCPLRRRGLAAAISGAFPLPLFPRPSVLPARAARGIRRRGGRLTPPNLPVRGMPGPTGRQETLSSSS
jgi:hypothetical protein